MKMDENIEDFDIDSIVKKYNNNHKIKINPEYEKIVPPLSAKEYDLLKSSIKERDGNEVPIIANQKGEILDGYHRYKACNELGLTPKVEVREFLDLVYEKEFVIIINLTRRQLNKFQISELGYELEKIEKEKAKRRQLKNLKNVNINQVSLAPNGA